MGKCFLEKYDGLGNDYLVLDPNLNSIELTKEKIKKICNRNFGVGSDGILYGPILKDNKIIVKGLKKGKVKFKLVSKKTSTYKKASKTITVNIK